MKPPSDVKIQPWTRKYHTRGRNGCLPCKQRHVRCDGVQPTCGPCAKLNKPCEFPSLDPPLRERRALPLPGQQKPWVVCVGKPQPHSASPVTLTINANPVDPFDSLPLQMPYKSKELLHYFFQHNHEVIYQKAKEHDIRPSVVHNPDALRDTLLVADLHYLWNARDCHTFQSTGLFHKIETIQNLNKQLEDPHSMNLGPVVKHIATLAFIESAIGNVTAAQAHLDGLLNILEICCPLKDIPDIPMRFDEEMLHRYLILSCDFIESVRDKMQELKGPEDGIGLPPPNSSNFVPLVSQWLPKLGADNISNYLKAMAMSPFLLTPNQPLATKFHYISALPFINCLKSMSTAVGSTNLNQPSTDPEWDQKMVSIEKLITGLRATYVSSHFVSLTKDVHHRTAEENITSFCSIAIASGMYLRNVLRLWNIGNLGQGGYFHRWIMVLARDLARSRKKKGSTKSNLWLWQHFVAAYSLAARGSDGYHEKLRHTRRYFSHSIQSWGLANDVVKWEDAHKRLLDITWPTNYDEARAKSVWEVAIQLEKEKK